MGKRRLYRAKAERNGDLVPHSVRLVPGVAEAWYRCSGQMVPGEKNGTVPPTQFRSISVHFMHVPEQPVHLFRSKSGQLALSIRTNKSWGLITFPLYLAENEVEGDVSPANLCDESTMI